MFNTHRTDLEALEVELLVAGVLVEDEHVRADARDDEAEVELSLLFEGVGVSFGWLL